jgi:septal ring-binding cell division protein DamX
VTQAFPVSGNIEPAAFPHLLVDLHNHGATGSLKVTGPHHPKALYFRGGRVLFGSSNDPRDQLGSILIESGKITREQLDEVNAKVGPGNPLAKVLSESGFVNQRELGDAARVKVERILADVLSWETGTFEFEDGVLPKGAVDLKLSTEKLLLNAVQRIPDRSFALRHVELRTVLAPVPEGETALSEIRAEVWPLLERLDGQRTLKDAIALTRLDEFEAAKTACALLFLGVVRKSEASGGEELDLAREAQSGLGAEDEPEPALFTGASQHTLPPKAPVVLDPAPAAPEPPPDLHEATAAPTPQEEDAPFVFPEPAPPLAPELSFGPGTEAEPDPTITRPPVAVPPRPVSAPSLEPPPAYPSPTFPAEVPAPAAPPSFTAPEPAPAPASPSAPVVEAPVPSFTTEPPARVSFDTVPGDRPAYTPPKSGRPLPLIPPPPRREGPPPRPAPGESGPEIAVAPSASRPNLKALDELLSPTTSARRPPAERSRSDSWQPQFRPPTASRRVALRTPQGSSSRLPIVLSALLMIVVGTVAAWYFLLRAPATPAPTPPVTTARAQPTPPTAPVTTTTLPPATLAAPPEPTGPPATTLAPAATPVPPHATPPPRATPAPRPTPVPSAAASSGASARVLLGRGALPEAAREFASTLRPGSRTRFSVQMLTACAPETVQKAVGAAGSEELFILPVALNGRACYRLCWGVYSDRQGAEAALAKIPAYFRQGGAKPRVSPLAELLP